MKKDNVQFKGPKPTGRAKAALISGCVTLCTFIVLIMYSGIKESTPDLFAILAVCALMLSFIGFVVSIRCAKEDNNYALPFAGTIVNGVAILIYVFTYIMGIV